MNAFKKYVAPLASLILLILLKQTILGCSCAGYPSVCGAYSWAEAVFVGTVVKVESIEKASEFEVENLNGKKKTLTVSGWKHTIKVEKTYKGSLSSEAFLATENSSCGGSFEVGTKLLLYAYFDEKIKMWKISACGRSPHLATANDDLLFLEGLPKTLKRTRISGDMARYEETAESGFARTKVFAGAKLKIASKTKTYEVLTDKNGVYEIYDLPVDVYTITPEIPPGLKIRFPIYYGFGGFFENLLNETGSVSVDLKNNICVGVDFLFNTNNKISGRVFDVNGDPMKNVCLQLVPLAEKVSPYFRIFDCTEKDGSYNLDDMPAGKYLILANDDGLISSSEPFPHLYYPDTFDKEKAKVVTIGEGEYLKNFDIRVPSRSETITVTGVLFFSDGKPAADEFVEFLADEKQPTIEDKANTKTDSEGRFSLTILKGLKGKIFGGMFTYVGEFENCPVLDKLVREEKSEFAYFDVATPRVGIHAEKNIDNIVLKFPFPACKKAK